jgi:hypothetical protein
MNSYARKFAVSQSAEKPRIRFRSPTSGSYQKIWNIFTLKAPRSDPVSIPLRTGTVFCAPLKCDFTFFASSVPTSFPYCYRYGGTATLSSRSVQLTQSVNIAVKNKQRNTQKSFHPRKKIQCYTGMPLPFIHKYRLANIGGYRARFPLIHIDASLRQQL